MKRNVKQLRSLLARCTADEIARLRRLVPLVQAAMDEGAEVIVEDPSRNGGMGRLIIRAAGPTGRNR